jgi:hypothetical protein
MAQVKIEDVIDHLDSDIRKALEETIKQVFPNQPFDSRQAFRIFVRMVGRKCNTWEAVPDGLVRTPND